MKSNVSNFVIPAGGLDEPLEVTSEDVEEADEDVEEVSNVVIVGGAFSGGVRFSVFVVIFQTKLPSLRHRGWVLEDIGRVNWQYKPWGRQFRPNFQCK